MAIDRGLAPQRSFISWTWVVLIIVGTLLIFWVLSHRSGTDRHPGGTDDRLEQKEPPAEGVRPHEDAPRAP